MKVYSHIHLEESSQGTHVHIWLYLRCDEAVKSVSELRFGTGIRSMYGIRKRNLVETPLESTLGRYNEMLLELSHRVINPTQRVPMDALGRYEYGVVRDFSGGKHELKIPAYSENDSIVSYENVSTVFDEYFAPIIESVRTGFSFERDGELIRLCQFQSADTSHWLVGSGAFAYPVEKDDEGFYIVSDDNVGDQLSLLFRNRDEYVVETSSVLDPPVKRLRIKESVFRRFTLLWEWDEGLDQLYVNVCCGSSELFSRVITRHEYEFGGPGLSLPVLEAELEGTMEIQFCEVVGERKNKGKIIKSKHCKL